MFSAPDPRFRSPRIWSNIQLRRLAPLFSGHIANISGGDDQDKEGSIYQNYFTNADSYTLTNYRGDIFRGFKNRDGELELDLAENLPYELRHRFDAVFNHTTLEHIFDVHKAFHSLCELTRDVAIVVVPFYQMQHENQGYLDYWRFTPTCLRKLFENEEMTVIYEAANDVINTSIYMIMVASRSPTKWKNIMPAYTPLNELGAWLGKKSRISDTLTSVLNSLRIKLCLMTGKNSIIPQRDTVETIQGDKKEN